MSKTVGIVGGIGPESTIDYYRQIIASYRERSPTGNYPRIIINSIDLKRMIELVTANELSAVADNLLAALETLAAAKVDFAVIAANTPHIVFDEVRARSPLPLISIVEATCVEAESRGLKRLALFGTRFTMESNFYAEVFERAGLEIIVPAEDERAFIHNCYMEELVNGIFLPDSKQRLLQIVNDVKQRSNVDGVILGGTELPLILTERAHEGIPFLDTTTIHVKQIVAGLVE
jgi:aspartate racemase